MPATHFVLSGFPTAATAGVAGTLSVTAVNSDYTPDTTYSGTVHFSSSDPQAALPADGMLTNGSGTFGVTLKTAGTQNVTVTDTANPGISGSLAVMAQAVAFDFDTGTPTLFTGQGLPLDQSVGGVSAHFYASGGGGFSIQTDSSTQFHLSQFSGHYVYPNSLTPGSLDVQFAQPLTSITLKFATVDYQDCSEIPSLIRLTAFEDSITVGATTARGTYGSDTYPEGTLSFTSAVPFIKVEIGIASSMCTADFMVDNNVVTTTGTPGVVVTPAAADHLHLDVPATTPAGQPFAITVSARDRYNNVDVNYAGTVHFAASNGAMANYAFAAGDQGQHTFGPLTLYRAAALTLTGTDTVNPSVTGSTAFAVAPAAPAHLALQLASALAAGVPFDVTVTVQDAYGNTVTDYTGTVHFQLTGPVSPSADYVFTATDLGSHTFHNLVLNAAGSYALTAADLVNPLLTGGALFSVA